ncbi:hypothetical protein [Parasediminibacterium sp. JCM 36343]|uniref:hypothetical protein n=1 Tax=Parasediminibacterium sp. JCM 36343 TaxID=3374279 RepID=UPI00397BBA34
MKNNDATHNRPDGERTIEAPYVVTNIEERITELKDEQTWDKKDRNAITLFKTQGVTIVLVALHDEVTMSDIEVNGVASLQVIEGKVNVSTESDAFELCEDKMAVIQPNIVHSIYALKESVILMTIYKNTQN